MDDWRREFELFLELLLTYVLTVTRWYEYLALDVGDLAAKDDAVHGAADLHASKRRPFGFGKLHGLRYGPLLVEVHLNVRVRLVGDIENALRVAVELLHHVL